MSGFFISYRRQDAAGHAGRLFDWLRDRFGADRVFMDVAGIEAGTDFVESIEQAVGSCDALLAVIGEEWLASAKQDGSRRLDDPQDFVRLEIGAALRRNVRVIPLLVQGAEMPAEGDLPDYLKPLVRRQAVELRDNRWNADVDDLAEVLTRILPAAKKPGVSSRASIGAAATGLRNFLAGLAALAAVGIAILAANNMHLNIDLSVPDADGKTASADVATRVTVYPQYVNPSDAALVAQVSSALAKRGYKVQAPELVANGRTAGDVRFAKGDEKFAEQVKLAVEGALADAGHPLTLGKITLNPPASAGTVEVWLPALSKANGG